MTIVHWLCNVVVMKRMHLMYNKDSAYLFDWITLILSSNGVKFVFPNRSWLSEFYLVNELMKLNKVLSQNGKWSFKHFADITGIFVCPTHFSTVEDAILHLSHISLKVYLHRYGKVSIDTYQRFLTLAFLTTSVHPLAMTWLPYAAGSFTWVLVSCLQMRR